MVWTIGIIAFVIWGVYLNRKEKTKYFKLYTKSLKNKDKANAIAYGRQYYKYAIGRRRADQINIELTIQNDLKMANIP